MSLEIKPTQEAKIAALAATTGRDKAEILDEVIDSYFDNLDDIREMLDRRTNFGTEDKLRKSLGFGTNTS